MIIVETEEMIVIDENNYNIYFQGDQGIQGQSKLFTWKKY
jgi:hypothetical protein